MMKCGWCITGDHEKCPGTVRRRQDDKDKEPCVCTTCQN